MIKCNYKSTFGYICIFRENLIPGGGSYYE
ncbi:hypothetical protein BD780_001318 [Clostridium tetanomorphum]|nr:hypothetical protein [Clostridium tetanomorphum]